VTKNKKRNGTKKKEKKKKKEVAQQNETKECKGERAKGVRRKNGRASSWYHGGVVHRVGVFPAVPGPVGVLGGEQERQAGPHQGVVVGTPEAPKHFHELARLRRRKKVPNE
jgi:hypothetical protein